MNKTLILVPAMAAILLLQAVPLEAGEKETNTVRTAAEVLEEISVIPEKGIPPTLLRDAHAVAIVPGVIKVGLVVGGRHGRGVLSVRDDKGEWSNPVFVTLTGGSIGWQIGAQSTDVVLVFKSGKSVEGIMKGKFTLGADAAVAAGPVGRRAEAATDAQLKAEIYSYSRSRGLFAGVSVEGSALQIDDEANAAFYQREGLRPDGILKGEGLVSPPPAGKLRDLLGREADSRPGG